MTDKELIDRLGGPKALAQRLNLPGRFAAQRVCNWGARGIPAAVRLQYLDILGPEAVKALVTQTQEAA